MKNRNYIPLTKERAVKVENIFKHPTVEGNCYSVYLNTTDEYMCNNGWVLPVPVIVDGHHRFVAAKYLHDNKKLETIHCMYGGRMDVLEYLKGNTDKLLEEII